MAEGIRIIVDDKAVLAALSRLEGADRARAMDAVGAYLVRSTGQRFEKQVGPDGKPWKRLSPRTANKRIGKRTRGYDNILRVTNRLAASISYRADADSVTEGTNVVYAAIQQAGGKTAMPARQQTIYQRYNEKTGDLTGFVKKRASNFARDVQVKAHTITIPARPYLGIDDADRKEILAIVAAEYAASVAGGQP